MLAGRQPPNNMKMRTMQISYFGLLCLLVRLSAIRPKGGTRIRNVCSPRTRTRTQIDNAD